MGSVYNRGTRSKPNWYISYKGSDGKWHNVRSRQPTKARSRQVLEHIEARVAAGLVGIIDPKTQVEPEVIYCGGLLQQWADGLTNRNAKDDRSRMRRHLLPHFQDMPLTELSLPVVMKWIDAQRAAGDLSDPSIRHNLNLLSRFCSWSIERGLVEVNPVRQIPIGRRPKQSRKKHIPWLDDDALVRQLIEALSKPTKYMFYLGNRSGLRTGEIAGLRMSDFAFLDEGVIRVRYSYDGPLKEDKEQVGKSKWVPAANDCARFLAPWLKKRKGDGAAGEDYVFPSAMDPNRPTNKKYVERHWAKAARPLGVSLNWYEATRHSFSSRLLSRGASLDEVSAALGHSSPVVTRRYYDHFVRKSYSGVMKAGLDLDGGGDGDGSDNDES